MEQKEVIVAVKKYKIKNTNLLHNGDLKHIGDIVELNEKEALKLQDVLVPVKETSENSNKNQNNKNQNKTNKTDNPENTEITGGNNGK